MGILDNYKTYDVETEGYGSQKKWRRIFSETIDPEKAKEILNESSPWTILDVKIGASKEEIKKAFQSLIRKWHPDVCNHPQAKEMSQKIIAAYTILK